MKAPAISPEKYTFPKKCGYNYREFIGTHLPHPQYKIPWFRPKNLQIYDNPNGMMIRFVKELIVVFPLQM